MSVGVLWAASVSSSELMMLKISSDQTLWDVSRFDCIIHCSSHHWFLCNIITSQWARLSEELKIIQYWVARQLGEDMTLLSLVPSLQLDWWCNGIINSWLQKMLKCSNIFISSFDVAIWIFCCVNKLFSGREEKLSHFVNVSSDTQHHAGAVHCKNQCQGQG